jgi:hypothetical protein
MCAALHRDMKDIAAKLSGHGLCHQHTERFTLPGVEIIRQAHAAILDHELQTIAALHRAANLHHALSFGICIFECVGGQFVDDEGDGYGAFVGYPHRIAGILNGNLRAGHGGRQVLAQARQIG